MEKSVLLSKTFWFGVATAFAPLVPSVGTWIASNVELAASLWGGLTILLRYITKDKVILLP